LIIKVLFPTNKKLIERDKKRECWTAGEGWVIKLYEKFRKLKGYIGQSNFINNSDETPEETFTNHFSHHVCGA